MNTQEWTITRIEPATQCRDRGGNAMLSGYCFEAELLRGSQQHLVRIGITKQAMTTAMEFLLRDGVIDQKDPCAAGRALVRAHLVGLLAPQHTGQWEPTNHRHLTIDSHCVADVCRQLLAALAVSD